MITAFLEYLQLEKQYSKHTIKAYSKDIIAFKECCELEYEQESLLEINYAQIRSWIVSLVNKEISNIALWAGENNRDRILRIAPKVQIAALPFLQFFMGFIEYLFHIHISIKQVLSNK